MVMIMRIYVGNLSRKTTRADLRNLFADYGEIIRVGLAKAGPDGRPRRAALVEMKNDTDGKRAITALKGTLLRERPLKMKEAR